LSQNKVDLGSIGGKQKTIADNELVSMIKRVTKKRKQPITYFFAKSATKSLQLQSLITQIIEHIHEKTLFKIVGSISDMGTANQAAICELSKKCDCNDEYVLL
jgi:uncharacterized protein YqeY